MGRNKLAVNDLVIRKKSTSCVTAREITVRFRGRVTLSGPLDSELADTNLSHADNSWTNPGIVHGQLVNQIQDFTIRGEGRGTNLLFGKFF